VPEREDRFGDLGPGDQSPEGGAAERLAELDATEPKPPPPPRPSGRYSWVVGIAFLIVIIVVGVNSLPNAGRGFRGPSAGEVLPAFAAPSATSRTDKVANVKQQRGGSDEGNKTLACEVRGAGVVNICDLRRDKPVVLAVIVPGVPSCERQLDRFQRVSRDLPDVQFVAVVSGKPRSEVATLVRDHGWTFPVAVDRDLAVFNLYRVGFCPTTVFAYRGGRVKQTKVRELLSEAQLRAAARSLLRGPAPS
jgi:AhpC/TSA family protein